MSFSGPLASPAQFPLLHRQALPLLARQQGLAPPDSPRTARLAVSGAAFECHPLQVCPPVLWESGSIRDTLSLVIRSEKVGCVSCVCDLPCIVVCFQPAD